MMYIMQMQLLIIEFKNNCMHKFKNHTHTNNFTTHYTHQINNESFMMSSILQVLKTEVHEIDIIAQKKSNIVQFIRRMLGHLKELCLTKMSVKNMQQFSYKHAQNMNKLPLKQALQLYLTSLCPQIDHLISRLKQINEKKFSNLVRKKITDIFSEIMRQAYDMKMFIVYERVQERRRLINIRLCLQNCAYLFEDSSKVAYAFSKIKCLWRNHRRSSVSFFVKCEQSIGTFQKLASRKILKLKLLAVARWHHNCKQEAHYSANLVYNLVKNIYSDLINCIEDDISIHNTINEALRNVADNPFARVQIYNQIESTLTFVEEVEVTSNEQNQPISTIFSTKQSRQVQSEQEDPPHKLVNHRPGVQQLKCLSDKQVISFQQDNHTVLLVPLVNQDDSVGLFRLLLNETLPIQILDNVSCLAKCLGAIVGKIFKIKSRLTYYSKHCRTLNDFAKKIFTQYTQMHDITTVKTMLDQLFTDLEMDNFEIIFIDNAVTETFYSFVRSSNYVQLSSAAVKVFLEQFQNGKPKDYLSVNRNNHSFIIFPIHEDLQIKGFIKFYYYFEIPVVGVVDVLKCFINLLIAKTKQNQHSSPTTIIPPIKQSVSLLENGLEMLKTDTYEELEECINKGLKKIASQYGLKYYSMVLWPAVKSRNAKYYWMHQGDRIIGFEAKSIMISNLVKSPTSILTQTLSQAESLTQLLMQYPLYDNYKLDQYENYNKDYRVSSLCIRNRSNEAVCILVVGTIDYNPTVKSHELEPNSLLELAQYLRLRVKSQVESGVEFEESCENKRLRSYFSKCTDLRLHYDSPQQFVSVMQQILPDTQIHIYWKSAHLLSNICTGQEISVGQIVLPTAIYCSHYRMFNHDARYRYKAISKQKQLDLKFRSASLAHSFYDFVQTLSEPTMPESLNTTQAIDIEKLLKLTNYYVIFSIDSRYLVTLQCTRVYTQTEVAFMTQLIGQEFRKLMRLRKYHRLQTNKINLKHIIASLMQLKSIKIREAVHKFHLHSQLHTRRNAVLYKVLGDLDINKFVSQSFAHLRQYVANKQIKQLIICQKCAALANSVWHVFKQQPLQAIQQASCSKKLTQIKKKRGLTEISKIFESMTQINLVRIVHLFRIGTLAARTELKLRRDKAVFKLASILHVKITTVARTILNRIQHKQAQLMELFNMVVQQLELVRFKSFAELLNFLYERISVATSKLDKPHQDLRVVFSYCSNTHGESLTITTSEHESKYLWKLDDINYMACDISRRLCSKGIKQKLIELGSSIVQSFQTVRSNYCRRLAVLNTTFTVLMQNNISCAYKELQKHLRKCCRDDNKKSKVAVKDIENRLEDLIRESEINKENDNLNTTLNKCKKQTSVITEQFESLKLQHKIQRKTLSISLMLVRQSHQAVLCEKQRLGFYQIDQSQTKAMIQEGQSALIDLQHRKMRGAATIIKRILRGPISKNQKWALEGVLHAAYTKQWIR